MGDFEQRVRYLPRRCVIDAIAADGPAAVPLTGEEPVEIAGLAHALQTPFVGKGQRRQRQDAFGEDAAIVRRRIAAGRLSLRPELHRVEPERTGEPEELQPSPAIGASAADVFFRRRREARVVDGQRKAPDSQPLQGGAEQRRMLVFVGSHRTWASNRSSRATGNVFRIVPTPRSLRLR